MMRRTIIALATFAVFLSAMFSAEAAGSGRGQNWLIYVYICGTNLEQDFYSAATEDGEIVQVLNGMASGNIEEMKAVQLPPNVQVLINVNGATVWKDPYINLYGNGLYLYDSNGLNRISNWMADMGSVDTLKEFLEYGEKNYPADRRMLIFWDHGGLNGLCYDDSFTGSPEKHNLTFNDLHKALADVYKNSKQKPFEIICFDTCVSGSYELANSIADFSKYMVGSEPSMYGFFYTDWLAALANNSAISGAQIGKIICDSTMQNYSGNLKDLNAFSVINLNKMPELRKAYEKYFSEANKLKGEFARAAEARTTERYESWYVDLGTLAENTKKIEGMSAVSNELLNAIHGAVVYNCPGEIYNAQGISTYYPYVFDKGQQVASSEFKNFLTQKYTPSSQKSLYKDLMKTTVSGMQFLPVELNAKHEVTAQLSPSQLKNISRIRCLLVPYVEEGDESVGIFDEGFIVSTSSEDLNIDWTTGVVTEKFRAFYPTIDGHRITMELSTAGRDHNIYEVPVILNGVREDDSGQKFLVTRRGSLQIKYDLNQQTYELLGMGADIVNGRVRSRGMELQEGDEITPLFLAVIPEGSTDAKEGEVVAYTNPKTGQSTLLKATRGETFTLTRNTSLYYEPIQNGKYFYMFQFIAPSGEGTSSKPVLFTVDGNRITKEIPSDREWKEAVEGNAAA